MVHALIIDDNPKNVAVLVNMLTEEQVSSTQVVNPAQLPATLEALTQVDVIFLDLEMPGQNGYDVLKSLKTNPRFSHVPIIAYTVHVSEIHTASQVGFNGFLGKPLNADKFPDQLARILRGQPVWETI
jgi:two-component system, cell cycle response regulator DivK